MSWTDEELEDLAARCDAAFPALTTEERAIALAVLRELARGAPATPRSIAERARVDSHTVEVALDKWPGVYRDGSGRVVGFWGLALEGMPHIMRTGGRELCGWCAWDTLFLGQLLGEGLHVQSTCAATGRPVRLTVGLDGIRDLEPAGTVISFVDPQICDVEGDRVISSFCNHILFFASRDDWESWNRERDQTTFALTVDEAWRLGTLTNRLRFGEVS